ncbi:hypothetical protein Nepgr_014908 [Nepenthes gracilis]|uniref:Uncharacterized protein n=1 Tax=Nepenthes gracilis TaxID=150966 RepID=A0AAD3SM57_NEPGR|nr:hypothetical protein Nepgr_014908 [Nepenthes gracilis]
MNHFLFSVIHFFVFLGAKGQRTQHHSLEGHGGPFYLVDHMHFYLAHEFWHYRSSTLIFLSLLRASFSMQHAITRKLLAAGKHHIWRKILIERMCRSKRSSLLRQTPLNLASCSHTRRYQKPSRYPLPNFINSNQVKFSHANGLPPDDGTAVDGMKLGPLINQENVDMMMVTNETKENCEASTFVHFALAVVQMAAAYLLVAAMPSIATYQTGPLALVLSLSSFVGHSASGLQ